MPHNRGETLVGAGNLKILNLTVVNGLISK